MRHWLRQGFLVLPLVVAGTLSAAGTARVVRAHPWLTRGLERESLAGLTFENAYGGALDRVVFSLTLEGCARESFSEFRLWRQPGPAYAFHEPGARVLDAFMPAVVSEPTVDAEGRETFTVTFENPVYASVAEGSEAWVYPKVGNRLHSDRVWLTARVSPGISARARIWVDVPEGEVRLGGNLYTVANGAAKAPHRVYPYLYRVNAYLPTGKTGAGFYNDAMEKRVANLTELTHFEVWPNYRTGSDDFAINWSAADEAQLARLKAARAAHHPRTADGRGARIILGLTKGATWTLASTGGSAFQATALGHAAGDVYRAGFVQAVVALMEAKGFDGLDIDWEYPNLLANGANADNGEYAKYGLLLRDLAEAFFDHGWTLSVCTNQSGWHMPGGETLAAADYVDAMAYGPWPTFLGNAVMTQGINVCTTRGVPRRRIVVGQAIYSNAHYQYGWGQVANWVQEDNVSWPARWDCDTVWRAWSNANNGKSGAYANFTGPTTYRAKCNRARMEGYGGVMSWGYYSDTAWAGGLSLAMHQAQAIWPHDVWPEPPLVEGVRELDSEEDWFWLRDHPDNDARLVANITFAHDPLPIESFARTLDGNGHTLILPADVWLCTFGQTALIRSLTGTVRNLTVDLAGRVITRADRAQDTDVTAQTLAAANKTAVLAANLGNGGLVENVTVRVRPGAEVQGVVKTAAVVASVWCPAGGSAVLRDVHVEVEGTVRVLADNSGGTAFDPQNACVGALAGWLGCPVGAGLRVEDCLVRLGSAARIAADTGANSSAGGAVGSLNNANPIIRGLDVRWIRGAQVTGKQMSATTPMPWVASYSLGVDTLPDVTGRILGPREGFPFTDWWLRVRAPFAIPSYLLRLR